MLLKLLKPNDAPQTPKANDAPQTPKANDAPQTIEVLLHRTIIHNRPDILLMVLLNRLKCSSIVGSYITNRIYSYWCSSTCKGSHQ